MRLHGPPNRCHLAEQQQSYFPNASRKCSEYSQQDAGFTGYEIEIGTRTGLPRVELELTLGRDKVNAEFTNGRAVPRIVPARK